MSLGEKWDKDRKPLRPLLNEDLVCKDCIFVTEEISRCEMYEEKPEGIIYNDHECIVKIIKNI